MKVLYVSTCECIPYMFGCSCKPEDGVGAHGTGISDGYESLCRCWELNPGPLKE